MLKKTIMLGLLSILPVAASAAESWNYCAVVDRNGSRYRFTNIFHLKFTPSERDLRTVLSNFEYDLRAPRGAAGQCFTFRGDYRAFTHRQRNVDAAYNAGMTSYVVDYDVYYDSEERGFTATMR